MKQIVAVCVLCAAVVVVIIRGCFKPPEKPAVEQNDKDTLSQGYIGAVISSTNAGRYTYLDIDTGDSKDGRIWVASPRVDVMPGDTVTVLNAILMTNFYSPTLKKTFNSIYFTGMILGKDISREPASACPAGGGQPGNPHDYFSLGSNSFHSIHGTPTNKPAE